MSNMATKRNKPATSMSPLYDRIRAILASARANVARSVNSTQVVSNWLIGREIVEEEQHGKSKAAYGEQVLGELSVVLQSEFGKGYSATNLRWFRQFYLQYPELVENHHAPRDRFEAVARQSDLGADEAAIWNSVRTESWHPGMLNPNVSWTHYRALIKVDRLEARGFYEIETIKNNWSSRELERQINSLLYDRLAMSRDKRGLMKLAIEGHEVQQPTDVFKDPVVMEFLGLPESPKLVESSLEQALIDNLQAFLLELGKGFAFVSRQERLTLDGDHFYVDLVFYHTILKCYVLIDLKTSKLTHQDLGQLQLYVNYYDIERRTEGDNPTLGLILCADKNDAVVKYTLGPQQARNIFASRYKLHLPTEAQLQEQLRREVRQLAPVGAPPTRKRAPKKGSDEA